ncbi:hypothetical protein EO087_00320 [Dyella sp. M7H15-1]|uniref:hypothetical protein n=1 Tax=Dyella sp. M7H15-1 TaxID=2501295 RepID=UPI0010050DBA|nr:hypothetical protein [Dyella sp. M7H15-1]QAU22610.1 hypothetical protein EO087_00320 [Dyella sp. M7H15-1]
MEYKTAFDIVLGAALTVLGWVARELWGAVKELRADFAKLRAELPREYVLKEDMKEAFEPVHQKLDKIFDKLEEKADKV